MKSKALSVGIGGILCRSELADGLFQLDAVEDHVPSASDADDAHLASDAHHAKMLLAAGMRLFELQQVPDLDSDDLHSVLPYRKLYGFIIAQMYKKVNGISRFFTEN